MTAVRTLSVFTLIAVFGSFSPAQEISPSVLNIFRYGTGRSGIGALENRFTYLEELMDIRVGLPRSFSVGVRFLYDSPPEIGPPFRGIQRRYAEFSNENVTIRAGNSSQLFGMGLALNLFEDRGLAYDTWLDGVKFAYDGSSFRFSAIAGRVEYWDSVVVARREIYDLKGVNLEFDVFPWLTLGGSFVGTDGRLPALFAPVALEAEIPEIYTAIRIGSFEAFAGWSQKQTMLPAEMLTSSGSGVYCALSWTGKGIGLALDYKDYRYDIRDPFGRYDPTRPTRMLPIQNPPTVQREHTWTFLTRALHQVDFNDEVGMQFEGFFKPDSRTTVTVNASFSSEHDYFEFQPGTFTFARQERTGDFLPSSDPALSPYWEMLVEGEHYFEDRGIIRAAVASRRYTQAVSFTQGDDHIVRSLVLPASVQFGIDAMNTLTLQAEYESVSDNYNVSRENFQNFLLGLTFSRLPGLSLGVRCEFTTNPVDPAGRKSWFAGEVGYRLGSANTIILTVGQERGGQVCSNGVCRYIQPFSGLRLAMQSNL
jgi:hypothetical protein